MVMGLLNIALAILLLLVFVASEQSSAIRALNDYKERELKTRDEKLGLGFQSLPRGPVPPSGPSGCTYIPGSGGPNCPLGQKHYAGIHATAYPRLMVQLGVAARKD